ncbi:hypothetical protein [Paludibacterium denitrificans]|uniref:hypothetical protein n=1 Tax=Paludibacterium denitrificans TaxID=2675226 RepID=UPI001E475DDA|nr:hypothetical protein [Paludibacterium denitrificans]
MIDNRGLFGPHLGLAMACEQGDEARIRTLAKILEFDVALVNRYYMDSVVWAQEILRDSDAQHNVEAV